MSHSSLCTPCEVGILKPLHPKMGDARCHKTFTVYSPSVLASIGTGSTTSMHCSHPSCLNMCAQDEELLAHI